MDTFSEFFSCIEERLVRKRDNPAQINSAVLTQYLATLIAQADQSVVSDFFDVLDTNIERILADCTITFNMPANAAFDAYLELSQLAGLYYSRKDKIYEKICNMLRVLKASYP